MNCFITHCNFDEVKHLYAEMKNQNLQPNLLLQANVINFLIRNKMDEAKEFFELKKPQII